MIPSLANRAHVGAARKKRSIKPFLESSLRFCPLLVDARTGLDRPRNHFGEAILPWHMRLADESRGHRVGSCASIRGLLYKRGVNGLLFAVRCLG
jgi:hypothetical protein